MATLQLMKEDEAFQVKSSNSSQTLHAVQKDTGVLNAEVQKEI